MTSTTASHPTHGRESTMSANSGNSGRSYSEWSVGFDSLFNDLVADPTETRNLVDSEDPAILKIKKELESKILEKMRKLDDPALAR